MTDRPRGRGSPGVAGHGLSSPGDVALANDDGSFDATAELISTVGVSKSFVTPEQRVEALRDVSLVVRHGEFVSLVGPSGCGKSTLLNIVAGLVPPTSGQVAFKGMPQYKPRRELGMMFQSPVLLPWRTVEENIMLPAEILHTTAARFRERVDEVLELTELSAFRKRYPWELSGGMAQRVALCRLLAFDPQVLLMDEPFGALDEFTRETMDNELLRIWSTTDKTVIFVTHNIGEAVYMSDRVVVMSPRPGRIAGVLDVTLPRPRDSSMLRAQEYLDTVFRIRTMLGVSA